MTLSEGNYDNDLHVTYMDKKTTTKDKGHDGWIKIISFYIGPHSKLKQNKTKRNC